MMRCTGRAQKTTGYDQHGEISRKLSILYRVADIATNNTTGRATNIDTFRQACLNTDFCKPGLQWSKFITSSLEVPVLGLQPQLGKELLNDPAHLLGVMRAIIHHNAIVSMFSDPILLHRVGKVGGRLPKKNVVQIWGDFQLTAGTKTYLKNCVAWMTEVTAPWLEQQWQWVRKAEDEKLEKQAQDVS